MLGPAPVLPLPCGWELKMAGVFPLGWQISVSPPCSGLLLFHVHTPLVHCLFLETVFIPHFIAQLTIISDLTSLSYLTSTFPTRREESNLDRLKVWGPAANPPQSVLSHRLYVHSAVSNWKKCLHSIKLKDSVLSLV